MSLRARYSNLYICPLYLFEYLKNDIYITFFNLPALSSIYIPSLTLSPNYNILNIN